MDANYRVETFKARQDRMDYSGLPDNWSRIILDGDPGSGKTTLAKHMAEDLEAKVVSLDDYLPGNRPDCHWDQIVTLDEYLSAYTI